MKKIFLKSKKGITLLEVIISVAILSIIIVPISMMVATSVRTSNNSESKQQATAIAQKLIEDLKINREPVGGAISLLNGTIALNKMAPPDTGHDIGYKATNLDVGEGFTADMSFQRRETYKGATAATLNDSDFDAVIEMTGKNSFKLTGTPTGDPLQSSYTFSDLLYIAEVSDTVIEIYDTNKNFKVSLQSKSGQTGKIKIVCSADMESSKIKVSSYNTIDSDVSKVLTVYCYKNNSGTVSDIVSNNGGYVNIYDDLKVVNVQANDTRGIYDVTIELYKMDNGTRKKVYDVKSSVNLID